MPKMSGRDYEERTITEGEWNSLCAEFKKGRVGPEGIRIFREKAGCIRAEDRDIKERGYTWICEVSRTLNQKFRVLGKCYLVVFRSDGVRPGGQEPINPRIVLMCRRADAS